jgi:arylsulfatase A-like enzyme
MFTGTLPRSLGLGQAPGGSPLGCRPVMESLRARMLPAVLRAAGYSTLGVSTNVWIAEYSGFATGFDEFHLTANLRSNALSDPGLRSRLSWDLQGVRGRVDDGAAEAERILTAHLDAGTPRPFFWFVNLSECHSPYLPPRPYNDLPIWRRLQAAREARRHLTLSAIWRASLGGFDIADGAMARMRHLYEQSVRAMDDWVARLLEALDARRLLDDTIVVVTSDHGENLGEGELIGHAFSLDDRLIHVPLIISDPSVLPTNGLVSLADLPRAMAEAAGLERHPWSDDGVRHGEVAIAQLDALVPPTDPRAAEYVEKWGLGEEAFRRLTMSMTCATDGRFKLVRRGTEELVYDLEEDRLELSPLDADRLDDSVPSLATLRAAVTEGEDRPAEPLIAAADGREEVPADEAEAIAERMRTLGYL